MSNIPVFDNRPLPSPSQRMRRSFKCAASDFWEYLPYMLLSGEMEAVQRRLSYGEEEITQSPKRQKVLVAKRNVIWSPIPHAEFYWRGPMLARCANMDCHAIHNVFESGYGSKTVPEYCHQCQPFPGEFMDN